MQIVDIQDINIPLLQMKLLDMRCKHVLRIGWKEQLVLQHSKECGYEWCLWGSHNGHAGDIDYHKNHIYKMQKDNLNRPIRIVICSYPFSEKKYIWVDNFHSCIHYVRRYGFDVKLKDIPFYVVDISDYKDILYSYKESVINNPVDVARTIECAYHRRTRSNNKDLLQIDYSVADFLNSNMDLYSYKNINLGIVNSSDSIETMIAKTQAFNTLWTE